MNDINTTIQQLLQNSGIPSLYTDWTTRCLILAGILLLSFIAVKLFRHLLIPLLQSITSQTKATWDDHLFNDKILHSANRLIVPIIWYLLLPFAFSDMLYVLNLLQKACLIYFIAVTLVFVKSFTDSLYEISSQHETLRNRPLKGIYQMVYLITIIIGAVLIISILIDKDATTILTGLGASAAVLMLIFKDSILGLVAGVQLSANDMLRPGDWISMPKFGADGYITEVTLTTVKVQNFDKTITTIPPYALVSDSFQNWRGMRESGGRRIKRSIFIDANTIRFCTEEECKRLQEKGLLKTSGNENVKQLINLRLFRNYVIDYLKSNPEIHPDYWQIVRMLQPTPEGIPLEIYCFSKTTEWIAYEDVQNRLFEHIFAVLHEFGLKIFQRPSGQDFRQ